MTQPRRTVLDDGFRLDITIALANGTVHTVSREISASEMQMFIETVPESAAALAFDTDAIVADLRNKIDPDLPSTHLL